MPYKIASWYLSFFSPSRVLCIRLNFECVLANGIQFKECNAQTFLIFNKVTERVCVHVWDWECVKCESRVVRGAHPNVCRIINHELIIILCDAWESNRFWFIIYLFNYFSHQLSSQNTLVQYWMSAGDDNHAVCRFVIIKLKHVPCPFMHSVSTNK